VLDTYQYTTIPVKYEATACVAVVDGRIQAVTSLRFLEHTMAHSGQTGIVFESGGLKLLGRLLMAQNDNPKPTAILLHGLPGIEQNYDIALGLRDRGWNAVIFHFRGCWGSEGSYTFTTLADDVTACLDYLASGVHPQVDASKIVLLGHSMGGWAAVMAASHDPRPRAVALIGPVVAPGLLDFDKYPEDYVPWLPRLNETAFSERWLALGSDSKWSTASHVSEIAPRPIVAFHARHDDAVPLQQSELLAEKAKQPFQLVIHDEANHSFTWHRPWLREQLFNWLDGLAL
jgi:uncharacterized protein